MNKVLFSLAVITSILFSISNVYGDKLAGLTNSQVANEDRLNRLSPKLKLVFDSGSNKIAEVDASKFDVDMAANGNVFSANLNLLNVASVGEQVTFKLDGVEYLGRIKRNELTNIKGRYIKINLSDKYKSMYMTTYVGQKITRGKIYTEKESYIYEYDGVVGFIMPIYDYKKLKGALKYD